MATFHGLLPGPGPVVHHHRRPRHQVRQGKRLAALRASTAAEFVLFGGMALKDAAERCGSCVPYVAAMVALLQSGNSKLLGDVLAGRVPVLVAGQQVASAGDLAGLVHIEGEDNVFTQLFGPPKSATPHGVIEIVDEATE